MRFKLTFFTPNQSDHMVVNLVSIPTELAANRSRTNPTELRCYFRYCPWLPFLPFSFFSVEPYCPPAPNTCCKYRQNFDMNQHLFIKIFEIILYCRFHWLFLWNEIHG